jgi:internalin A
MTSSRLRIRTRPPENWAEALRRIDACIESQDDELSLENLGLRSLPEEIAQLTWLTHLSISSNLISQVPEFIGRLVGLESLSLAGNPISVLPASLAQLSYLETLLITDGTPSAANSVIGKLPNLISLSLAGIGLKKIPDWIQNLHKLEALYLNNNELQYLPDSLSKLSRLVILNIAGNDFRQLPSSLLSLTHLRKLYIDLILGIPKEIIQEADARRILDYYFRIKGPESQQQPLNEFKLILVGRGGVGKTTLVHRLTTNKYKEFKRTPGINITKWPVQIDGDQVQAHIWDFGGQEIMHGTHRFFMTERALYLVLISGREGTEDHDAEYWLSLVRSFAGNVPIIILLNKWDDYQFELNRQLLKEKYGKNLVFVETDSRSGTGMSQLHERICQLAKRLPGLKAAWPSEWRQIKEALPRKKKSWLTFDDFREFCTKQGIDQPKDQEALADSLHHLGLMLSYRKDEALRDFGVLNPQWVTKGIYQILNSPQLRKAQGKFTPKAFADVLPGKSYPKAVHPYLLALMRKFQLCHPLDDKGEKYLIPELLTKEEPNLDTEFPPDKCLGFEYRYDTVLPEGLLPRFIVETYFLREPKLVWRTGAVLERANCRALVRGDIQGRQVVIRVTGVGNGQRELLGIIREHFERIHRSFEKLPVTELVPIPKSPQITVPYEELLAYERAGDDEYKVVIERVPIKFSVAELLDGVDLPGSRHVVRRDSMLQDSIFDFWDLPSVFISYAHEDERFRDELRGALTPYERSSVLEVWDDTCMLAGQKWEDEILAKLEKADIVVLLLSNDFIGSDYSYQKEMQIARERDKAGECAIVPIVVRACRFDRLELGQLQAILPNGKPIKQNKDRDAAWLEVTKQLDRVIARFNRRKPIQ